MQLAVYFDQNQDLKIECLFDLPDNLHILIPITKTEYKISNFFFLINLSINSKKYITTT